MVAGTYDFVVEQGDTFSFPLTWYGSDERPVILGDYTARMHVRTSADAEDFILELTTENGGITLGNDTGIVTLFVSAEDMAEVAAGSYKYDLEMVDVDGNVRKILKGKLKVLAEVTK